MAVNPKHNRCIGITGGIGSGKSLFLKHLSRRGYVTLSADVLGRRVCQLPEMQHTICQALGSQAVLDGHINTHWLRQVIFQDGEKKKTLEALIHPGVRKAFLDSVQILHRVDPLAWVFYESALLIETGQHTQMSEVVLITAPQSLRLHHLLQDRGLENHEAQQIMDSQMSDEQKAQFADFVISNHGTEKDLTDQCDDLLIQLHNKTM